MTRLVAIRRFVVPALAPGVAPHGEFDGAEHELAHRVSQPDAHECMRAPAW